MKPIEPGKGSNHFNEESPQKVEIFKLTCLFNKKKESLLIFKTKTKATIPKY